MGAVLASAVGGKAERLARGVAERVDGLERILPRIRGEVEREVEEAPPARAVVGGCLLYTSDAADE